MNRVFIVHRWDGSPESDWYPWLKIKLLAHGDFEVKILEMPEPHHPKIVAWVSTLKEAVGKPDKKTFFVGHSIGCQAILRYLEKIEDEVGGAILVAPWFSLTAEAIPTKNEEEIARPWLEIPLKFWKIKNKCKFVAIFSDNDPYVPLENSEFFRENLGAKIIVESGRGHYTESDGVKEVPLVLEELLEICG
jgi:predicted alpha/beta hydrolase family esterase